MTPNEISHYESLKKQDIGHRKLIKKLQLNKKALKEQLILSGVSHQREQLIDFAEYSENDKTSTAIDECVDNYLDSIK
tara:strand:+ start:170 stop:403 length:234 start_codon:yes stop_codon:yes gene_type:complete